MESKSIYPASNENGETTLLLLNFMVNKTVTGPSHNLNNSTFKYNQASFCKRF